MTTPPTAATSDLLWTPSPQQMVTTNLAQFIRHLQEQGVALPDKDYDALHHWSITEPARFWETIWQFCGVIGQQGSKTLTPGQHMIDTRWFAEGSLNFAENLLKPDACLDPAFACSPAIIACDEQGREEIITRSQLLQRVTALAIDFRARGLEPGDRVAGVLPNTPAAIIAMLAAAAIGAAWSSCSPEFGADAICDRLGQIQPRLLITASSCRYHNKPVTLLENVQAWLPRVPSIETIYVDEACGNGPSSTLPKDNRYVSLSDACAGLVESFRFPRFPFNHPLYILYSSGTTGSPKCIIHGQGGSLLQHLKEHQLHCDIKPGDRVLFYTSTGWMMWNWLASVLASSATIVLFDGSPLHPQDDILLQLASRHRVTHFGAGARYYATLEERGITRQTIPPLPSLRCVLSTGSPLLPRSFDYIYQHIKEDICLASISGGTDILSCFVLGCPLKPVMRGQIQTAGLGMNVQVRSPDNEPMVGEHGELVCTAPFPSMPVGFWNDPGNARYLSSYFEGFPNIWSQGDWAIRTPAGGFIIEGRSDATLNPGGIRIGTAEIYQQVQAIAGITESLATAWRQDGDEQIVLFVRLAEGVVLDKALVQEIRTRLRQKCSPRHVPRYILAAPDLPRTLSGKLSEIAARSAIHGRSVGNTAALANPECLSFFTQLKLNTSPQA